MLFILFVFIASFHATLFILFVFIASVHALHHSFCLFLLPPFLFPLMLYVIHFFCPYCLLSCSTTYSVCLYCLLSCCTLFILFVFIASFRADPYCLLSADGPVGLPLSGGSRYTGLSPPPTPHPHLLPSHLTHTHAIHTTATPLPM